MSGSRVARTTGRGACVLVLLAGVSAGCMDAANEAAAARALGARDSAGVRIVVSDGEAAVPAWRVATEPQVEVGGTDAGFVNVAGALRTEDGFVVGDAGTGEMRFYDAAGLAVRQDGGKGRGPGEFHYIGWIGVLPGDSLAAWDPLLRRVSVFSPNGYARSFAPAGLDGFFPSVYGTFSDGSLLMSTGMESAATPPSSGAWRDTMVLLRIGRTGEVVDTIGRFPGPSRYAALGEDGVQRTHSVPFGPATWAVVHRDEVYVATGERYEITVHGDDGRLRKRIRSRVAPIPVTRRERESYAANVLQSGGSPREQRVRRAAIESAPFPRTMAPVKGLHVDIDGNVWVQEPQAPDTWDRFSRWSVFDPAGRRVAEVEAPGRFTPAQIGRDWALGRTTDADGTQRVRLYRLER
jgi:hypothetical protein